MATLTTSYQLIAEKYIGDASSSTTKNVYLRIYAKYTSQDIGGNKSNVSYKSTLYVSGGGTYFYTGNYTTKSLSGTGATAVSYDAQGNYYIGETTLCEISGVVAHGSSGEASVSITAGWESTPWGIYGSLSGTATLPTIARATTPVLASSIVTMGTSVNITLSPANSTFKHKLRYDFGSVSGSADGFSMGAEFTAQGNTTVTFTPPTSLGSQIPNTVRGTGQIVCYTYTSSGTHIGTTYVTIYIDVPAYAPTITDITLTGNNLLNGAYVSGKSSVTINATLGTQYGAGAKRILTSIDDKSYSGLPLTTSVLSAGSKTAKITFYDTRDRATTVETAAIQVYAYSAPSITEFALERQSDGTTVVATLKGTISAINNKNSKTITVTLNGVTNTITSSSYTINGTTTFTDVPTDNTLTATANITDSYTSATKDAVLPTVEVTMDFHHSGKGVAFGKVAEFGGNLDVNWQGVFRKGAKIISPNNGVLTITRENSTQGSSIKFENDNGALGYIGMSETADSGIRRWKGDMTGAYFVLDTGNFTNYIKDYVVEQGTSGIWTYRKWNSGLAECWGVYTMTSAATKTWGSLYYSDTLAPRINYPFTFTSRPQESAFLHGSSVAGWVYPEAGGIGLNSTTQTGQYGFVRPTTIASSEVKYEYTVVGRWK